MKKYPLLLLLLLLLASLACSITGAPPTPPHLADLTSPPPSPTKAPAKVSPARSLPTSTAPAPSPTPPAEYTVNGAQVNLRACPGIDCRSMGILSFGQVVTVTGSQTAPDGGLWSNVQTKQGLDGFVNSKYLTEVKK